MEATHKRRGRSGFWAGAAGFLVILGFLSLASTRVALSDTDTDKHEHVPIVDVLVGCGSRLKCPHDAYSLKMRDIIRERKVVTYIDGACARLCSVLFMAGVQRFMASEAILGFDRGSFPGVTGEEPAPEDAKLPDRVLRVLNSKGEAYALNRIIRIRDEGSDRRFADHASAVSIQWFTAEELRGAGVITGVASRDDLDVWRAAEILQKRQVIIDHIPSDLPDAEKGQVRQAINRSLDALQTKDLSGAAGALQEIVAILERYPDSDRGDPAPGHIEWLKYWRGFYCRGFLEAGVYAVCYWSGVLGYSDVLDTLAASSTH